MDSALAQLLAFLENRGVRLRGQMVFSDADLADFYQVNIRTVRGAPLRRPERFPEKSYFQLQPEEQRAAFLDRRSARGTLPYVFTAEGAAALSAVLQSARAIKVHIGLVRSLSTLPANSVVHENLDPEVKPVFNAWTQLQNDRMQNVRRRAKEPKPTGPGPSLLIH